MAQKVLLMILDGWGKGGHNKADVIYSAQPEFMNSLEAKYPNAELRTDGENVGLPDGQMGNSEVGHLNIGAGRVVYQDLVKINRACRDNSIMENKEVKAAFEYAKERGVKVHFMGLVSDLLPTLRTASGWICGTQTAELPANLLIKISLFI